MISRDRVIRTLNHRPIDRAARDLWLAPGVETARADDVAEISVRFPLDFLHLDTAPQSAKRPKAHGTGHKAGTYTDAWGCVWKSEAADAAPILAGSPLANAAALPGFHPPAELLAPERFAKITPLCEGTGRFTLATCEVRPLERLCQLRGPDTALRELAEGKLELRELLTRLHDFFCSEADQWGETPVDGVVLGDDLTWPAQSRVHLGLWRSIVRPIFRDCCEILHGHDKFVFFLARGPLGEMIDDLIEIGVDAVHADWPLEEFINLAASRRGRIVFWGGLEDRRIEPPSQPAEVREGVFRVRKAADFGAGGIISQVSCTKCTPLRNIAAFFEQWLVPLPVAV